VLHSHTRPESPHKDISPVDSSSTEDEIILQQSSSYATVTATTVTSTGSKKSTVKHQYSLSADDVMANIKVDAPPLSPTSAKRAKTTPKTFAPSPLSSETSSRSEDYGSKPDPKREDFFIRKFNLPPEEKLLKGNHNIVTTNA
jgi:hypothetical protein